MKTNIFYFSSTGNSLMVTKDIAAQLPETQIFSIPKVINGEIDLNADNIGIIFPVYFSGMPRLIINFIDKLNLKPSQYIFTVCTCGAFPMGSLVQLQKQLQQKGLTLHAGFSIPMPGNYIVKYGAFNIKKQQTMFSKEKTKIETIIEQIKNQQPNQIEQNNAFVNWIGNLIYKTMFSKFPTLDQNFTVNKKCNHCNTCEKVCPVNNIKMIDGKPQWLGNCEHCLACIQWCPMEAIQYSTQTLNRKRYHHPNVTVKEFYR